MKKIYILLTKTNTIFAKGIRLYTQEEYSHSSLCLDNNFEFFYSFSRKYKYNPFIGCFSKESINEGVYSMFNNIPCKVLELQVSETQFKLILNEINTMKKEMGKYKYNYIGILFAIANKPYHSTNRYYCSEFIYHILKISKILTNEFDNVCIKPTDFTKLGFNVIYEGNLHELYKINKYEKAI